MENAKLQLRLPQDLKDWLKDYAARNDRTMNGQVVAVLRELMRSQEEEGVAKTKKEGVGK